MDTDLESFPWIVPEVTRVLPYPLPRGFQHRPLEEPEAMIRLFRIDPEVLIDWDSDFIIRSLHPDLEIDDITGTLETWRKDMAPPYIAISYTWGDAEAKYPIQINGETFRVPANCLYALRQAQRQRQDCLDCFWIDSICIDQKNLKEKGHQVRTMGDIFAEAHFVLACVGPCESMSGNLDDSPFLYDSLQVLQRQLRRRRSQISVSYKHLQSMADKHRFLVAFVLFAHRQYWKRLWVVQELLLAKDIWIACGARTVNVTAIVALLLAADDNRVEYDPWHRDLFESPMQAILQYRRTASDRARARELFTPTRALMTFSEWKCTNPMDKIYGLQSIVRWPKSYISSLLLPDYNLSNIALALRVLSSLGTKFHRGGNNLFKVVRSLVKGLKIRAATKDIARWVQNRRDRFVSEPSRDCLPSRIQWVCGVHDFIDVRTQPDGKLAAPKLKRIPIPPRTSVKKPHPEFYTGSAPTAESIGRARRAREKSILGLSGTGNLALGTAGTSNGNDRNDRNDRNRTSKPERGNVACDGSICPQAEHRDILLQLGASESVHLVIRKQSDSLYEVVGQALIHPQFDTCSKFKYGLCKCRSRVPAERKAVKGKRFTVHFQPQDLLVLAAQDNMENQEDADRSYFDRVATRPNVGKWTTFVTRE